MLFQSKLDEEKVFKDPVHRYIYVQDQLIWKLINTQEFQRLRRIRQLGTTYLTFHGAEHSRFNHSLGVYEVMRRVLNHFEKNHDLRLTEDERLVCLCAALLHDIGHAPFSHSIEPVFETDHEEWSIRIIREQSSIADLLREYDPKFPGKVAQLLDHTHEKKMFVSLISSQLDVDRMDYLLRDAYYTGVNYGTFDLERVLRVMRPENDRVLIKASGMHAVEDYLVSRYQMFWQVYFHPVTRSAEILLHKIFLRAHDLFEQGYAFRFLEPTVRALIEDSQHISLDEYIRLDEALMQMVFRQWENEPDPILSALCKRFIHRDLFKYIGISDQQVERDIQIEHFEELMRAHGYDPKYFMDVDYPKDKAYHVYNPNDSHSKLPIMLSNADGSTREISKESAIVKAISGETKGHYSIYAPEEMIQKFLRG